MWCAVLGLVQVLFFMSWEGGAVRPKWLVGWVGDDVVCPMSKLWPVGRDRGMGMGETSDDVSLWFPKSFPSYTPTNNTHAQPQKPAYP